MPTTCKLSNKKGKTELKKSDARNAAIGKDANVNSNHSTTGSVSPKHKKIDLSEYERCNKANKTLDKANMTPNKKSGRKSKEISGDDNQTRSACDEIDDRETQRTEFIEEGEIIQMEINDGGATAEEFASEGENADVDTDSEADDNYSEEGRSTQYEMEDDHVSDTEPEVEQESFTCGDDCVSESKKKDKQSKMQRLRSVEDTLDDVSSTLAVMKNFFLNNGLIDNEANTSKKKQGGGDRVKGKTTNLNSSVSDMTIYKNVLEKGSQ